MADITLVIGGIKSGKTSYAQNIAKKYESKNCPIIYLATAQPLDEEMKERIKRHKADRPKNWLTVEEPINIEDKIKQLNSGLILLDCLTLWITNKICKAGDNYIREDLMDSILKDLDSLLKSIKTKNIKLVIVSNQVESGLISSYPMGRLFQDLAGLIHQKIAREANNVVLMTAGLAQYLKGDILL